MRVALYVRVSTKEQVDGYSIDEQIDKLNAYAKAKDYTVLDTFVDGGHSGATIDRPAIKELIKNIKNYQAVLVYRLNRLSRSQKDTLHLIEDVFMTNNVEFISLSESLDTSTPFGRAMIGILSAFAQLDREQIKEQLTLGRVARAKNGYYHGGDPTKAPTGYDYVNGDLIVNEYEAECVRYIYDEYVKGKGYAVIYEDIQTKFPGVINDLSTVSKTLMRPLYKGYVTFDSKEHKGRHQPIIDDKTYKLAQDIRLKRKSRFKGKSLYILSGLLHCGHCGARIAGHAGKKLKNGEQLRYYTCYTKRGSPKHMITKDSCNKKFERKEQLEDKVIKQIKKLKLSDVKRTDNNDDLVKIDTLNKEITKIDKQISNLVDLFANGNIPTDILNDKINGLNDKKESMRVRIEELGNNRVDTSDIEKLIPSLNNIDKWDAEEQQVAIIKLIDSITLYDDRLVIDWVF